MFGKPKEEPMPDPKPTAHTDEVLHIDAARLDGVTEEIARFMRKLDDLRKNLAGAPLKPSHPAVKACRRASQDVSNEMVALRALLKE